MLKDSRIYVAGHKGLVGSSILRRLKSEEYTELMTRTHKELNLINQADVGRFFEREKPEYVFLAAAKVGGILANHSYPAEFIYENLMVQTNVIHAAYKTGVKKLLFLGSSCIYPRECPQPMKEEYLLTGKLETTNESYAVAKIAGIKMCQAYNRQYGTNFVSVMPTNLYGPGDNFDLETSHVLPALIRKFHEAKSSDLKEVVVWGTGKPLREFLYVEDLADALQFLMENVDASDLYGKGITHLNIGTGQDLTIKDLAILIKQVIGFEGEIVFDTEKPDGTPRKLMDVSRMTSLGWRYKTGLQEGIEKAYIWFLENNKTEIKR